MFALKGKKVDAGVKHSERRLPALPGLLSPGSRCLIPFTSFSENELSPGGSRQPIWFALNEKRPLAFFAGIWTRWTSIRKVREGEVTADLFSIIYVVHPQAMPVILTTKEKRETWLRAP